jgi:hypothetical protein
MNEKPNDITIFNLYRYVKYDYDNERYILHVSWDYTNKELDNMMNRDLLYYRRDKEYDIKHSCEWVGELKNYLSWERGNKIHFHIKNICKGGFSIMVIDDDFKKFYYDEIGEDGYLYITPFSYKPFLFLEKCHCVYNDLLEEQDDEQIYIFK